MILEKNNLQTAQEWTKSYIELIASYVHPKTGNHLRSHLRTIITLDHPRLIMPVKKIRPNFLRSTSLLCKILPTNPSVCKPTFYTIYKSHLRYEALFLSYRPRTESSISNYKLHSFSIQDDGSTHGLLAKLLKKFPKSPIRPSGSHFCGSHFCSASCGECLNEHLNRLTLQHDNEL